MVALNESRQVKDVKFDNNVEMKCECCGKDLNDQNAKFIAKKKYWFHSQEKWHYLCVDCLWKKRQAMEIFRS